MKRSPSKRRSISRTRTRDQTDAEGTFSTSSTPPPAFEEAIRRDFVHDKRSSMTRIRRPSPGLRTDGGPSGSSHTGESKSSTLSVGSGSTTSGIGGSAGRHSVEATWTEGTPSYTESSSSADMASDTIQMAILGGDLKSLEMTRL